jgi:hypothetical protein
VYTGTISCECGQQFYCESINNTVTCPHCGLLHKLVKITEGINDNENSSENNVMHE